MRHRILRTVTFLVIFFFTWTMGGMSTIAYAAYHEIQKPKANKNQSARPEAKFQKAMDDLKDIVSRKYTSKTKRNKIRENRDAIESLDKEIKSQFADTENKLKNAGLPQEILQRHYNFVKHYENNLKILKTNLDSAENAKTDTEFETQAQKIKQHLDKTTFKKTHKPLDPNKLPHRTSDLKRKEPRTKPEEFQKDLKHRASIMEPQKNNNQPLLVASAGELSGLVEKLPKYDKQNSVTEPIILALAHDAPASADLSETIDVQLTPAIKAKAAELGYSPVKIYNWVRNNVEYVPTYGSIQGADMCLQTLQGNDFDIASLLIALLRASNIPARYVYGTVELPINKVMNWVGGFTDANAAVSFIASGGTPVAALTSGGKISSVRMEHVWVEAYVKYYPMRGAKHVTGQGDSWIPLDASYKQYTYTQGIDIDTAVSLDNEALMNHIQSTATIDTVNFSITGSDSQYVQQQLQNYQSNVQSYINQNYPNATIDDFYRKKEIIKHKFTYLLGTLPYQKAVIGVRYSEIPDTLRYKITFKVTQDIYDEDTGTPINITKRLPEIAGKKITLSYSPATATDEETINSYFPKPHADGTPIQPSELPTSLPAYLINLKPELRIDGVVVAKGTAIGMGYAETFDMVFTEPGPAGGTDIVTNQIDAGAYHAVAINTGKISQPQMLSMKAKLEDLKSKLENNNVTNSTKDDIIGEILYGTALAYYSELDSINYLQSKKLGVAVNRTPSESIFSLALKVDTIFDLPRSVSAGGLVMDVDRNVNIISDLNGDKNKNVQFLRASGMNSSALEHKVPERMFSSQNNSVQGVSAVKALKIANDNSIPIFVINKFNINTVLPQLQLAEDVITDIQNAINAGNVVTVSKTNINFNGWTGCGYIIIDPSTGAGAYRISGGLNGCWTTMDDTILKILIYTALGSLFTVMFYFAALLAAELMVAAVLYPWLLVALAYLIIFIVIDCYMQWPTTTPSLEDPANLFILLCISVALFATGI